MKKKETKEGYVGARVRQEDLNFLKKHNINISALISDAISSAAKKLRK